MQISGYRVTPEHDNLDTVDTPTDSLIFLHFRSLIRAKVIVQSYQLRIVCGLGRGHVSFQNEPCRRHGIVSQSVQFGMAGCGHLKAALKLQVKVLHCIRGGRCTLDVRLYLLCREGMTRIQRIRIGYAYRLLIALILRQFLTFDNHVRKVGRQLSRNHLTVCIENLVSRIPFKHQGTVLCVCNPVVHDLICGKVIGVYADAIDIDCAVIGTDGNSNG